MSGEIVWAIYRKNDNESGRQPSNINFCLVRCVDPDDARRLAGERNPFGEGKLYLDKRIYAVMSLDRLMPEPDIRGTLLIKGDLFAGPPILGPVHDGVSVF